MNELTREEDNKCELADTQLPDVDPLQTIDPRFVRDAIAETFDLYATVDSTAACTELTKETGAICDQFLLDFSLPTPPVIENYLPNEISELVRAALIEQLVAIELVESRKKNLKIDTTKYFSRFPQQQSAVQSAFRVYDQLWKAETLLQPGPLSSGNIPANSRAGSSDRTGSRFNALRLHAKGGLGAVFLAKDTELGRTVALKEIQKKHAFDKSSQDRFIAEAIVTGSLEHPGIVPVYGLGRYADGRPFYAMRFLKGTSFQAAIDQFHIEHPDRLASDYFSRPFKALMRNFIDLCSAIFYAHEHGVLHRDIKPDNVMLGKYGETMVVDWGLAKVLLNKEPVDEHYNDSLRSLGGETQMGAVLGTPAYMSPEQAHGKQSELDARADIYSLGATLFTVLTNQRPIDGKSSIDVVLNVRKGNIRRIENIAPYSPPALNSICYKSMRSNPADRYRSAGELIEDIERWLTDELVLAHQDKERPLERMGRLFRRYHTWAVAGTIFLAACTAIAVIAILLIDRARYQEVLAKNQARAAKTEAIERYHQARSAIDTWLVGSSDAMQSYPGMLSIRKQILKIASEDYERLAFSPSRDDDLELERARAFIRLGDILQLQQQMDEARNRYRDAGDILKHIAASPEIDYQRSVELCNIHSRTGVAYFLEGNFAEAKAEYTKSIDSLKTTLASNPSGVNAISILAANYVNLGELQHEQGENESAILTLQTALTCCEDMKRHLSSANDSASQERQKGLDSWAAERAAQENLQCENRALELLGRAFMAIGKYSDSDQLLERAINQLREQALLKPDDTEISNSLASALISRADVLRTQGRQAALETALSEAINEYQALHLAMPDDPRYAENLALTLTDFGIAKQTHGLGAAALEALGEAQQQWQSLLLDFPNIPRVREQAAACEDALAQVILDATGEPNKALQHVEKAKQIYFNLAISDRDQPSYRHRLAIALSHAGLIESALDHQEQSLLSADNATEILRDLIAEFPMDVGYQHSLAHVLSHRGEFQAAADRTDEASKSMTEAIALWAQLASDGHVEAAHELAILYLTCPVINFRDSQSAVKYAKLAVDAAPQNPRYKAILAIALLRVDNTAPVKDLLSEIYAEQGDWVGRDFFALSLLSKKTGDGKADEWLEKATNWVKVNQPGSLHLKRLFELVSTED